jgi:hypothetical protein
MGQQRISYAPPHPPAPHPPPPLPPPAPPPPPDRHPPTATPNPSSLGAAQDRNSQPTTPPPTNPTTLYASLLNAMQRDQHHNLTQCALWACESLWVGVRQLFWLCHGRPAVEFVSCLLTCVWPASGVSPPPPEHKKCANPRNILLLSTGPSQLLRPPGPPPSQLGCRSAAVQCPCSDHHP